MKMELKKLTLILLLKIINNRINKNSIILLPEQLDMYKNFENNNKQSESKLVQHLKETLFIENESMDRISSRIVQTPIQEVK